MGCGEGPRGEQTDKHRVLRVQQIFLGFEHTAGGRAHGIVRDLFAAMDRRTWQEQNIGGRQIQTFRSDLVRG